MQLLEPLSHLFEAKTIDEYSEDDAPANIDTERPHAHCTEAAMVRGRRMNKNSDAKKTIAQNRTLFRDPPPPYPHPLNVAETHCSMHQFQFQFMQFTLFISHAHCRLLSVPDRTRGLRVPTY